MVPLISPAGRPASVELVEDVAWFNVDGSSVPGAVRRAAVGLADQIGFASSRCAEVGVAVTEAVTNLLRHADEGRVLLRVVRPLATDGYHGWSTDGGRPPTGSLAVEFVAIDSGPGMADVTASLRDGSSTRGTLGVGMGAIGRLSDGWDVHSTPGRGTVMVARFLPRVRSDTAPPPPSRVAGLTRPITGETVCGDAYATRTVGGVVSLLLCDGLGHGELAARAAVEAARLFRDDVDPTDPAGVLRRIHQGISHTRGAAAAVAVLDAAAGVLRYAGLGNISGIVLDGTRRTALTSKPGIVGYQARRFQELRYPLAPDAVVVMHSDGVSNRWDLTGHPGVTHHAALVIAATVLRDAGLRRDDSCVLVAVPPWI